MITEIGITAGDILHTLEQHGTLTVEALVEKTQKERDLLLMGLGWLAREGHVVVDGELDRATVALKK